MRIIAANAFIRFKKKSTKDLQQKIDKQVKQILSDPEIGEQKKADLKGIRVSKFKHNKQLFLLSYEIKDDCLNLYTIGSHENFYKKLKNILYLREEISETYEL
jgi:mRNA-degrading endonuclease YafQ of YafQ-DinJ toxin-antitoxin module